MITACQANTAVVPHLKDGGSTVQFAASGQAVTSTGPAVSQAKPHVVEGALDTPQVTLEWATPRHEPVTGIHAAAYVLSGSPPQPEIRYQIDYSTDAGRTWQPMVKDWTIPRRGQEPGDFGSQSFCYGSATVAPKDVSTVRVRFQNNGSKRYMRAELSLVYRTPGKDATKVTFDWTDDAGSHREAHVFDSKDGSWSIPTGKNVRTRWVEYEPVAGK
jgi:hypothetical protein